jgi:serine/threonine protein phosphatase 1
MPRVSDIVTAVWNRLFRQSDETAPVRRVPAGTRVYAVGDIHGQHDLLRRIRRLISDDAEASSRGRDVVVYLGDYIDRGPGSRQVIETILSEPMSGFEEVYLKGNHEDFMLEFLDDPRIGEQWYLNGGDATLASYGIGRTAIDEGAARFSNVRDELRRKLPVEHMAFLRDLSVVHVEGDYVFVHAGIRPGRRIEEQRARDLLWIRSDFLSSDADHGCCVVHGHSISPEPEIRHNRIGIDTGAYYTGRLTCLVLDGAERRMIHT